MLINDINNANTFDFAFGFINYSNFEFHLTGSRFFEKHNPDSDFDYFCLYDPIVQDYLKSLGFEKIGCYAQYQTGIANAPVQHIYRFKDSQGQIDIQMCSFQGFEEKLIAHRLMERFPILVDELYSLSKEDRKQWWTKMHSSIRGESVELSNYIY